MNRNKGFSLIELMVIISIIGVLASISVPGFISWQKNARFKEAGQLALSALRQARGQAINLNQKVTVLFTLDSSAANDSNSVKTGTGSPIVYNAPTLFNKGIEIKRGTDCDIDDGEVSITFNPSGGSNSRYVCILDGETNKYRIGIATANTGRILFQKYQDGVWQ